MQEQIQTIPLSDLLLKWTQNHQQTEFLDQYLAQLTDLSQKNKVQHWIQLIKGNLHLPPITWSLFSQFPVKYLYAGDLAEFPTRQGFIGLSITQSNQEHLYHDMTQALPLEDSTVDFFQSEDVFEHIPINQIPSILNEIYRVLKPGSKLRLSVPDYRCDILDQRSQKNHLGEIVFDPGGGGTPENPGHLWFPKYEILQQLINQTQFANAGKVDFLHYYDELGRAFMKPIDHRLGRVKRTPDFDARVQNPPRPMSLVVDLYKTESNSTQKQNSYIEDTIQFKIQIQDTFYSKPTQWRLLGAQDKAKNILEICHKNAIRPNSILEVGAGDGAILKILSEANFAKEYNAVELSSSGLNVIKQQHIPNLKRCETFNGYNLPFADKSIDLIILSHVLEHVEHERLLLREIKRVSKYQVIEIPTDSNNLTEENIWLMQSYGHINAHSLKSLKLLFHTEGFLTLDFKFKQYSLDLMYYNHFVNGRRAETPTETQKFIYEYKLQLEKFTQGSLAEQENQASCLILLTKEEELCNRIERVKEQIVSRIFRQETNLAEMIFDFYIPEEHQSQVAQALYQQYPREFEQTKPKFIQNTQSIKPNPTSAPQLELIQMGSDYGGWPCYPQLINKESVVYSFGIGEEISFDIDLMQYSGCQIFGFDPTPKSIRWVEQNIKNPNFKFFPVAISEKDGKLIFNLPKNPEHVSCSVFEASHLSTEQIEVEAYRLSTIMKSLGHQHIDLLKMDIEGSEYGVIDNILNENILPTQILIEFHHRFESIGLPKTLAACEKLKAYGYKLLHIKNEMEYTFVLETKGIL